LKSYTKLYLTLLAFAATLIAVGAVRYLVRKQNTYHPNPVRPKDFPDILIVPESAKEVDYSEPSQIVPGVYSVSFVVNDPHPSESIRNFIEKHLKSKGWQRLKYHLMNPETPISLSPFGFHWSFSQIEDWLNENDDHISIHYAYEKLDEEQFDLSKVQLIMTFFRRDSWIGTEISRYKELHPEEFSEDTE